MRTRKILHGLFWLFFSAEIAGILAISLVPLGGMVAPALIQIALYVGLLGSALGSLPRPRMRLAVILLGLHTLLGCAFFAWPTYRHFRYQVARQAEAEAKRKLSEEDKQRTTVVKLLKARRILEAQKYLSDHSALDLHQRAWLRDLLCAFGQASVGADFLSELQKHKAQPGELLSAAAQCSREAVRAVLDHGVAPGAIDAKGRKALMTGTNREALKLLVERGASVNARDPIGSTALMFHRTPEITRFLLEHGADLGAVDKNGWSVLHYGGPVQELAACYEVLIAAGADPNRREPVSEFTPLLARAARHKEPWPFSQSAADVLVKRGADPMALDSSRCSAIWYLITNEVDISRSLQWPGLKLGGPEGAQLLSVAIEYGRWEAFDLLLRSGANPGSADLHGEIPLELYRSKRGDSPGDERYRETKRIAEQLVPP